MTSNNWLELGALLLVVTACLVLWRGIRERLRRHDGFEGIIEERRKQPARRKLDIEEEIDRLESILNRK